MLGPTKDSKRQVRDSTSRECFTGSPQGQPLSYLFILPHFFLLFTHLYLKLLKTS